jgi:aryl-alcohol dehydrogenase-like predicted oxidoreductase
VAGQPDVSRRQFLQATGAGTVTGLVVGLPAVAQEIDSFPQRVLGKTALKQPILGMGTAPAGLDDFKAGVTLFHEAIDLGVTYMDTAPEFAGYGKAQQQLGEVLRTRRKEVFLVTKCFEPDGEKALALLNKNLRELQTDHADLVYAHSIGDDKMDLKKILGPAGVFRALEKAQNDGLTRFVGCSGHNRPWKFLEVLRSSDIAVMMNAVNFVDRHTYDFETKLWPEAAKRGVGLVAMKIFGGIKPSGKTGKGSLLNDEHRDLAFRYALTVPGVSTAVIGMHDRSELHDNIARARSFHPLSPEELAALEQTGRDLAIEWKEHFGKAI